MVFYYLVKLNESRYEYNMKIMCNKLHLIIVLLLHKSIWIRVKCYNHIYFDFPQSFYKGKFKGVQVPMFISDDLKKYESQ